MGKGLLYAVYWYLPTYSIILVLKNVLVPPDIPSRISSLLLLPNSFSVDHFDAIQMRERERGEIIDTTIGGYTLAPVLSTIAADIF